MIRNSNTITVLITLSIALSVSVAYAQPVTKVVVAEARMVEAPATITLVGTLMASRQANVSSEVEGIVSQMPVRQGDLVKKGDVLCVLNTDVLRYQLLEAEARLGALRAQHEELLAGTRKEDLRRLKALMEEAEADFKRWEAEMTRVESLYQGSQFQRQGDVRYQSGFSEGATAQRSPRKPRTL